MIKFNKTFYSANGAEVVIKIRKFKKSYYLVEFIWNSNIDSRHFASIVKKDSKWKIFTTEANYLNDYSDVAFKTLTEAIKYIGITEIENKDDFNIY